MSVDPSFKHPQYVNAMYNFTHQAEHIWHKDACFLLRHKGSIVASSVELQTCRPVWAMSSAAGSSSAAASGRAATTYFSASSPLCRTCAGIGRFAA